MSRLLVFGAQGQVGTEVVRGAQARGFEVLALARAQVDVTDRDAVHAAIAHFRPDAVINCAAYNAVDKAESEPDVALANNAHAPRYMAQACAASGAKLIHYSTDYVFDGRAGAAWTEADTPNPLSAYGRSKLAGEIAVREELDCSLILRVCWVFGELGNNFVKAMVKLAQERESLNMVADQSGSPTPAKAIADTSLDVVARWQRGEPAHYGVYHYCGAPAVSRIDWVRAIHDELQRRGVRVPALNPVSMHDFPAPAARPANSVLSSERFAADYGIAAPDWRAEVARLVPVFLAGTGA